MGVLLCHSCAAEQGHIDFTLPGSVTGTEYQLEKYMKHTAPSGSYPVNSVFESPDHAVYSNYIVGTMASGCVEIDDHGRANLIYFAGEKTGARYEHGEFVCDISGVKVVLAHDEARVHGFPTGIGHLGPQHCERCGTPLLNPPT